jgi:hypothetical protein
MPAPRNIWINTPITCPKLRWLRDNQAAILKARKCRGLWSYRPLKVWQDGKVRIEFCHTWPSIDAAYEECRQQVEAIQV